MGRTERRSSLLQIGQVDPKIKSNVCSWLFLTCLISNIFVFADVVNKTLAFHTSVNYEFKAPEPFTADVHEDLLGDLARISKQSYPSDYDLHIDFSRTLKRLDDGHCVWINACYVRMGFPCISKRQLIFRLIRIVSNNDYL